MNKTALARTELATQIDLGDGQHRYFDTTVTRDKRTDNVLMLRFSASLGEEHEVVVVLD
jgi:hypothetical protein